MGIAGIITAVATTATAVFGFYKIRTERMLYARPNFLHEHEGCFVAYIEIYPSQYQRQIRKISSNAAGIACAEKWDFDELKHKKYCKKLSVQIDVPPSSLTAEPTTLCLAFKLRESQRSIVIFMYKSFSLFAVRYRLAVKNTITTD